MAGNSTTFDPDLCTLSTSPLSEANFKCPVACRKHLVLSIFVVLFFIQLFLGIRYRTWGFLAGIICRLALEVTGYVEQVQPHYNPFPFNPFLEYLNHPVQPHPRTPHALFHGHSIANTI